MDEIGKVGAEHAAAEQAMVDGQLEAAAAVQAMLDGQLEAKEFTVPRGTLAALLTAVADIPGLRAALATAKASLSAHKGQATRARKEARALQLAASLVARKCGPLKPAKDAEEAAARRARIAEALAGYFVDIVASAGKRELLEIAPVRVDGDAWRERPDGHLLTLPLDHAPGDIEKPEVTIAGYGLFDAAGEQVGWRGLPEKVRVAKNSRVRVERSVIF